MFQSPFTRKKKVLQKEPTFYERWKEFLITQVHESFLKFIPSDDIRQLPPQYLYPFGLLSIIFLIGIFFSIFLPGYLTQLNTQYLSPTESAESGLCQEVPISNTGLFLATRTGIWSGGQDFSYSQAAYTFDITNLLTSPDTYATIMWGIYQNLVTLGLAARNQTLSKNILYWMAFVVLDPNYSGQRFYLVGNPPTIFYREFTSGGVSSVDHDCVNISSASFDQSNALLSVSYNYFDFISCPYCQDIVSPSLAGYSQYANPDTFQMKLDVRTLIVASAINSGILSLNALQKISSSTYFFSHRGTEMNTSLYIDPAYPEMRPVSCILHPKVICVMILSQLIGLPIFNHLGASMEYPDPCNCTHLNNLNFTEDYLMRHPVDYNYFINCNSFKWLSGLLIYNTTDSTPFLDLILNFTYDEIVEYSYYPMFIGSSFGINSPYYSTMSSPQNRKRLYEFCYNSELNMYCSFLTFASFNEGYQSWSISVYYYQLANGACRDTFSTTRENWAKLVNNPYSPLTQEYQKCSYPPATVLSNQAGIAVGNVSLLAPFAAIIVLVIIYYFQLFSGKVISKGYTKNEKDEALDAFAISLLLAKDDKLEYLHQKYLSTDVESGLDYDRRDIEEGKRNLLLLVKELGVIGNITPREYYRLRKDDFRNQSSSVNWKALYETLFITTRNRSNNPVISKDSRKPIPEESKIPRDESIHHPNVELTEVNPMMMLSNSYKLEDSEASRSQETSNTSSDSQLQKQLQTIQILNQTKINSKDRKKYEEYIDGKNISFFSALYQSTVDKSSFRTVSLISNSRSNSSSAHFPSVDAEGIVEMSRLLSTDGTFIQSFRLGGSVSVNPQSSFDSTVSRQNGSKILEELYSTISARTSRYNAEVMKIMMEYWMPRIDRWSDEFGAMVEKMQYAQNNPQSKRGMEGVPASYWTISSMVGELQLFTLITKELLVKYVEELKAEEGQSVDPRSIQGLEPKKHPNLAPVGPIDISNTNKTPEQEKVLLSSGNSLYDCSEEDYQMIFFLVIFYKKIQALLVYHSMLSLSIFQEEMILSQYERKVGYLIGREVWTLGELREWIARFQGILSFR